MTKKLVTILAEELPEWPVKRSWPIEQDCLGGLYVSSSHTESDTRRLNILVSLSEDFYEAIVTRVQWEAECARILAESQPERDPFIKELVEIACKNKRLPDVNDIDVANLNQALWDKVAIAALPAVIRMEYTMADEAKMVEYAARYADAFMAERAERMKG